VLSGVVEHRLPLANVLPEPEELAAWTNPLIVARYYRALLDDAGATIAEILAILSDPSAYPAVFHGSAGKDRTGVVAAVLLGILGVPDDTIVADYALSAGAMVRLIAHMHATYPDGSDQLHRLAAAIGAAEPAAMRALLEGLRCDYGSFDGYAAAIGVDTAPRYVREALLV